MKLFLYKYAMMTFLVVPDFILNAQILDPERRLKQIVEAKQLIMAIEQGTGWNNHPAAKAWRPYVTALKYYYNCVLSEFLRQGGTTDKLTFYPIPSMILIPWWIHWDRLHQSHRAMLLRKDPFYYQDKFTVDPEFMDYGYIWPDGVVYENRNAPLSELCAPIPPELINPTYCQGIIKSGARAGSTCNNLVKPPSSGIKKAEREHFLSTLRYTHPYCGIHRRYYS